MTPLSQGTISLYCVVSLRPPEAIELHGCQACSLAEAYALSLATVCVRSAAVSKQSNVSSFCLPCCRLVSALNKVSVTVKGFIIMVRKCSLTRCSNKNIAAGAADVLGSYSETVDVLTSDSRGSRLIPVKLAAFRSEWKYLFPVTSIVPL